MFGSLSRFRVIFLWGRFSLSEAGIRGYLEPSDMLCLQSRIAERSHCAGVEHCGATAQEE
jgi:hypothetical protein